MSSLILTVGERLEETHDVTSWRLLPAAGSTLPPVQAGQCITVHCDLDGEPVSRAYTLSSAPQDPYWQITIKEVGRVSAHLRQHLQVGDSLTVNGPFGEFVARQGRAPLLLSAGSGITPMWAMARTALAQDADADIRFIHSARSEQDVIFAQGLGELALHYPGFRLAAVLEQSAPDHPWQGRLSAGMLRELAPDLLARDVYLCGPAPYMAAVEAILAELGLPAEQLLLESFGQPEPAADVSGEAHFWFDLAKRGKRVKILPGQTLLAAAEAAGESIPFACRAGVCGACKVTVSGDVERQSTVSLTSDEIAAGVVLACACTARSDIRAEL